MSAATGNSGRVPRRVTWSWALYDWGNSAFATTVIAGFFPVFFKQFWAKDLAVTDSTFQLGLASSIASLMIVVLAPILGTLADRSGAKKRLLGLFAFLGVSMSAGLYTIAAGAWPLALLFYVLGTIGFSAGNVVYDALLLEAAPPGQLDRVSALGYALGYLGGGLLFALNLSMVLRPAWFGLSGPDEAVRLAFLTVAVWWGVFALPVLLFVPEAKQVAAQRRRIRLVEVVADLSETLRQIRRYRQAFVFLLAYWLYIDGVDTIVHMAVDYGLAIGFGASDLLSALLVTQLVGFPAALVFGQIGQRFGAKPGIWLAIAIYTLAVFWAWRMQSTWEFYALAVTIGLVQGGIQALSRSLYASLIPPDRAGEFFGFYNMLGKFAAVFGPLLVGWVAAATDDPRAGILSIVVLFALGAAVLSQVDVAAGADAARRGGRNP